MIEGFCPTHANDIPLAATRWCTEHRTLCLPPSWSDQHAVWPAWPPRPAGWVYAPRQLQESQRATVRPLGAARKPFTRNAPKTTPAVSAPEIPPGDLTCHHCRQPYTQGRRTGGPTRRFCSARCRARAAKAVQRIRQGSDLGPRTVTCAECGTTTDAVPVTGGIRRRYCSAECGRRRNNRRNDRTPMADRGMRCEDCGRDDRPHKGRGLCSGCWAKARRQDRKVAP